MTRCNNLDLRLDTFVGTLQLDMSSGVAVKADSDDKWETLWCNRCERVTVQSPGLAANEPQSVPISRALVDAQNGGSWLNDQFRVRMRDGELQTVKVERETGGYLKESKADEQETLKEVRRVVNEALKEKEKEATTKEAATGGADNDDDDSDKAGNDDDDDDDDDEQFKME